MINEESLEEEKSVVEEKSEKAKELDDREKKHISHKKKHHKKEKKKSKKQSDKFLYISIAVIAAIVIIIIAFMIYSRYFFNQPKAEKYVYNGFEFTRIGDLWYVKVQPEGENVLFKVPLHFGPREVKNISVVGDVDSERFNKPEIYLTFDPVDEQNVENVFIALSVAELSLSMAQALGAIPVAACAKNLTEACADRPIVDCSSDLPVIYLKDADEPKVTLHDTCVLIEGRGYDLVRATDRLLLWWYGIMRER